MIIVIGTIIEIDMNDSNNDDKNYSEMVMITLIVMIIMIKMIINNDRNSCNNNHNLPECSRIIIKSTITYKYNTHANNNSCSYNINLYQLP